MARRTTRVLPTRKPYKPSSEGEQLGYTPVFRTRKAPKAYWRRKPPGYGEPGSRPVEAFDEPDFTFDFGWKP